MRSFNKARLIDIADKGLDPQQPHVAGPDGRLISNLSNEKDSQAETKEEQVKEEELELTTQDPQPVIFAQVANVEKKTKKPVKKSN
jgi:hypothetical protein